MSSDHPESIAAQIQQTAPKPGLRYPLATPTGLTARHGAGNCPACRRPLEGRLYVCERCWWDIPGQDRAKIQQMHCRKQDLTSKLASVVRKLVSRGRPEIHAE